MAQGEFIEILSPSALSDLNKLNDELLKTVESVKQVNVLMGSIKTPSGGKSAMGELNQKLAEQRRLYIEIQNELKKNAILTKQLEIEEEKLTQAKIRSEAATDRQTKAYEREQQKLSLAESYYGQIQRKLTELQNEYRNIALKKELNNDLTAEETTKMGQLLGQITKYDRALKAVDGSMGKYTRNVGNYAGAFNPLQHNLNQLTREAPAFAVSMSTGFLALSNNIPMFIDSVKEAHAQTRRLHEEGKKAPSIFSQLATALFSWQTALSVGVTLLTIYGAKLIEWVMELAEGEKQLESTTAALTKFQDAQGKASGEYKKEIRSLNELIAVAKDKNLTDLARIDAINKLKNLGGSYLMSLSLENIKLLDNKKVMEELTKAMGAKEKMAANKTAMNATFEQIGALEGEIKMRERNNREIQVAEQRLKKMWDLRASGHAVQGIEELQNSIKKLKETEENRIEGLKDEGMKEASLNQLKRDKNKLVEKANDMLGIQNKLAVDSAELNAKELKTREKHIHQRRERIALSFEEVESEYALKKAILERQKAEFESRMNDDRVALDLRLKAREEYSDRVMQLIQLEADKQAAVSNLQMAEDFEKNNVALRNKDITRAQHAKNIQDIEKRNSNEIKKIAVEAQTKTEELARNNLAFNKKIADEKKKHVEETEKMIIESQKAFYKKQMEADTNSIMAKQFAFEQYYDIAKKELAVAEMREMMNATSVEELGKIEQKYKDLNKALDDMETSLEKAHQKLLDYFADLTGDTIKNGLDAIGLSSLNMFLDIDKAGESTFQKLWVGAETTGEKFKLAFTVAMDIAKETFAMIDKAQAEQTERKLEELEKQKEIAMKFAGDNKAAQEKIEREYEEKKRALELKEFRRKQKFAIINIIMNTAQGVMAAIGQAGIAGIVFGAIIAAIGLAQIAMVAAQKPPAFEKGTQNAPRGLAYTDEKGAELHTDKYGNIKDFGSNKGARLKYLDKGDRIYTASETSKILKNDFERNLSHLLSSNDINHTIVVNNGITAAQMDNMLEKHIASQPKIINRWDSDGFSSSVNRNGNITRQAENRGSGIGINV
jgi:hypothetical protein